MNLTVELSENDFYHHKTAWKLDFTFTQLSSICEKHSPCYIFPLPEDNYVKKTLLKVDITQKEPITSAEELKSLSSNKNQKSN